MFKHDLASHFQKNNQNKLYIFFLAFAILSLLSGCRITKSAQLRELENLVSVIQLTTGREVSRSLQDKDVALGKPVLAEIYIEYEPINNYTKKEVYDEIVAILKKNNWKGDEWNIVPDYFSASLKEENVTILAKVRLHSDENLVSIRMTNLDR